MRPLLPLLAALLLATPAWARDAVVVLDRGAGAEADADAWEATAIRLTGALARTSGDARLVLYGVRADGEPRRRTLTEATATAIATAGGQKGLAFEGLTDPREALAAARDAGGAEPYDVFLVGPWSDEPVAGSARDRAFAALAAWNEDAPEGARVFPVGATTSGWDRLEEARGLVPQAFIVTAPAVLEAAAEPWSPLDPPGTPLGARLEVSWDPLVVAAPGTTPEAPAPVARLGRAEPATGTPKDGGWTFALERPATPPRRDEASVDFPEDERLVWLTDAPTPASLAWTEPRAHARLLALEGGAAPPFVGAEVVASQPHVQRYRLERTAVGPLPTWRLTHRDDPADVADGFTVHVGQEVEAAEGVLEREIRLTFRARPATPLEADGTLLLTAEGRDERFEIPYHVSVPPGRLTVRLVAERPQPLPVAQADAPWRILVDTHNGNVPSTVPVRASTDPAGAAARLAFELVGDDGRTSTWRLDRPHALPTAPGGVAARLVVTDGGDAPAGAVSIHLDEQPGIEGESTGSGLFRPRAPSLTLAAPGRYRVEDGRLVGDPPARLALDGDGGDGPWLLALQAEPPSVVAATGAHGAWTTRSEGPGTWTLTPTDGWTGDRPSPFSARTETGEVVVRLAGDGAGRRTVRVPIVIEVAPRWGALGWVLVALAALALGIGGWALLQHRVPLLGGTLLYRHADRPQAVGRLDLAGVGRRGRDVVEDEHGRLVLGDGAAPHAVARLRATRIGGILLVPGPEGEERRLLVDGLAVASGAWALRYVSGRPESPPAADSGGEGGAPAPPPGSRSETPDLLGPEYDLAGGRIAGIEPPPPEPPPREKSEADATRPG